ncbi:MAG: hypothetical protein SVG88_03680 [Halobacteriales archaeon]|nr:hypothetical protein [Halobacteriales archaeon]
MSDADPGAVTVSADGVTVHKYVDTEEFDALAVVFEIEIDRETPVSITLSDPIPDGIPAEDVGIHPEYGGEYWTIMEETVEFDRRFEDDEPYTTLYGVRTDEDDADRFVVEPTLSVAAPSDAGSGSGDTDIEAAEDLLADSEADVDAAEDILGASDKYGSVESSDIVREVISGERETVPGVEAEDDTADAQTAEEAMDDPLGDVESTPGDTDADEAAVEANAPEPASDASAAESTPGDVMAEGDDADADLTEEPTADPIADASEDGDEEPTPTEPATTTTMTDDDTPDEPAAAEESSAPADAEADMTEATSGLETETETATETEAEAEAADAIAGQDTDEDREMLTVPATGGVARLLVKELQEGHVDEKWRRQLRDALVIEEPANTGSIDARIDHLQSEVSDLTAYTEALEEFLNEKGAGRDLIDSLESDLETLQSTVDRLETRVDTGEETLSELEATVSDMEADIEELRSDLAKQDELAEQVDELSAEMDAMADDIENIKEFRDRMSAVFNQQTTDE